MNYVIAICLAYMLALCVAAMVRLIRSSRKGRLEYIKNFKKGNFVWIYLAVFPLCLIAFLDGGASVESAVWRAIKSSMEIVVLKYDYSSLSALMSTNVLYHVAIDVLFSLVFVNTFILAVSLCGIHLYNAISLLYTRKFRKKVVVVVGYNANSKNIVASVTKESGKVVLMDVVTPQMRDDAFISHADCASLAASDNLGQKLVSMFKKFNNKKVSVILNCEDDTKSLLYVKQICEVIDVLKLTELPLSSECGLYVFVVGSKSNETVFVKYVEKSKGLIKFVNRHMQIAMDFVDKYPLTQFMTAEQLDYDTATVRDETSLNVFMIGFGKLNETLFLTSVSNNQFVTLKDGKLTPKAVNYHIYDRNYPEGKITKQNDGVYSRSFNHDYMRYAEFLKQHDASSKDYLPFAPAPANVQMRSCDIDHPDFYTSIHSELSNKNNYSYIIISFGDDLENIDLAEKLQQKLREWDVKSTVKIFVKIRDDKLAKELHDNFENGLVYVFGSNKGVVYNAQNILNEKTEYMARLRHYLYTAEYEKKQNLPTDSVEAVEKIERAARDKWYAYTQFQRESNIFACLSIRMKLQMLGYDYSNSGANLAQDFERKYEAGNERIPSQLSVDGKHIWQYSNDEQFAKSVRWTYAVQEHQRWCANMICNGVIPSSIEEIKSNGGRIWAKRLHGNLTTMDGLIEYRKLVSCATGRSEEDTDVIRYDYQLMDDVVWLLNKCGYKLIEKENR